MKLINNGNVFVTFDIYNYYIFQSIVPIILLTNLKLPNNQISCELACLVLGNREGKNKSFSLSNLFQIIIKK